MKKHLAISLMLLCSLSCFADGTEEETDSWLMSVDLKEVVATATRPLVRRNATGYVVTVDNSKYLQNKSLDKILNLSPGVRIDTDGNLTINGMSGVTVDIDGRTLRFSGDMLKSYLRSLQGSNLKSIEVMPNPTAAYDAEGVGGVIRIRTKRQRETKFVGNLSSDVDFYRKPKFGEAAGAAYTIGSLTAYGNYSFSRYKSFTDRSTEDISTGATNLIDEHYKGSRPIHTYRAGIDWDITPSHYAGIEYNGQQSKTTDDGTTTTRKFSDDILTERIEATAPSQNSPRSDQLTFNYVWRIDTIGRQLKVIGDYYATNDNGSTEEYHNLYYDGDGSFNASEDKRQISDEKIEIYTAQSDFTGYFRAKTWKLDAGLKYAYIDTHYANRLFRQGAADSAPMEDLSMSDRFRYQERRYAAYATVAYSGSRVDANAGLRAELTNTESLSATSGEFDGGNDFRLFPSAFVYWRQNDRNGWMLYYGMRINRPNYSLVNPFVYYLTETSVKRGNPYLKPSVSNAVELTYVLDGKYYIALKTLLQNDAISDFTYSENGTTVSTFYNMSRKNYYYFNAYLPFDRGIWSASAHISAGLLQTKSGDRTQKSFRMELNLQNRLRVTEHMNVEVWFNYSPPYKDVYTRDYRHYANLGFSADYSFWKDRLLLTAGVDDIFDTAHKQRYSFHADDFRQNGSSVNSFSGRAFRISLKLNFSVGKGKSSTRRTTSSSDEERSRL